MFDKLISGWSTMTAEAKKAIKWKLGLGVGVIGVLALLAPVLFTALKAGIAFGLLLILIISATAFIPWFSMKMANLGVKAVVHEAQTNPIETLYNLARTREQEIATSESDLATFDGELRTFKSATRKHKERFQSADVSDKEQIIRDGEEFVKSGRIELQTARDNLQGFIHNIEMTASELELAKQMGRITDRMLTGGGRDVLTQLKAHAALQSAERKMNESLSKLSLVMSRKPNFAASALPAPQPNVVDIDAVVTKERLAVPVKRGE